MKANTRATGQASSRGRAFVGTSYGDSASKSLLGSSRCMRDVYDLIGKVAPSSASVLIAGESGTGKEVVARAFHDMSSRSAGPFIAVHCGAIPESLTEGELFGHEKGAFTGASDRKPGCFELADGGTLFLDELNAMPIASQAKLLRALEERSFRRLRGREEVRVDVRLVAAMNEDPETAVERGHLREDLFYRLNVFKVTLPPLRERREDIEWLAGHFVRTFAAANGKSLSGLTGEALALLYQHDWPGNVRELRNVIERAVILARGDEIDRDALPPGLGQRAGAPREMVHHPSGELDGAVSEADCRALVEGSTVEEATRWLILRTLDATGYNKTQAANMLGVSAKTVYNKLKQWAASGYDEARLAEARCRERWRVGDNHGPQLGGSMGSAFTGAGAA